MTRTKNFIYNTVSTFFYQIVVMVSGIVMPRVLLSEYGSEINGLVASLSQFINYFSLAEAGIAGASVYALYSPLAKKDYDTVNSIVSASRKFYIKAGFLFSFLVLLLAVFYPLYVKTEALNGFLIGILVVVLGAKGFLEFFTLAKYRVLLTADQKTYAVSNSSSVYIIIQTFSVVLLSRAHLSILTVYAFSIIALLSRSIILFLFVRRNYKNINYKAKPDNSLLNKRWDALFLQFLSVAQNGVPIIIATLTVPLNTVSVYSVFNMVMSGINGVLGIFINGLSASFGDVIARKEGDVLKKAYGDFEWSYYLLISVVFSVSFVMIMPFIRIYTSGINDADYNKKMIGFLFVLNGLFHNIKTPQGMLIISAGHYKETKMRAFLQSMIIVVFGGVLGLLFGIAGIIVSCILSNVYRDIDLLFYVPKNITKTKVFITFKRMIFVILIIIISVSLIVKFDISSADKGYASWAAVSVKSAVISSFVALAFSLLFEQKQTKSILGRIKIGSKV